MTSGISAKIIKSVTKSQGVNSILMMGDPLTPIVVKDVLSTGLPNLDEICASSVDGRWGLPIGRVISIKSKPGVGKTSFILGLAREAQKRNGAVHLVESEHALDLSYVKKLKCNIDDFMLSQPDTLEEAFETIDASVNFCAKLKAKMLASKDPGPEATAPFVILMDSFSGFSPKAELEGDYGTGGAMGSHARIASQALRKLTGSLDKAGAILVVVHQTKSKIGVVWGNPATNIGGDAFNFHDSICLTLGRQASIKSKGKIIGHLGTIRTTKNKLYPPFREADFRIINGKGFDRNLAIFEFLKGRGEIMKKGSWFRLARKETITWQGRANFAKTIRTNKKARILIKKIMREFYGST